MEGSYKLRSELPVKDVQFGWKVLQEVYENGNFVELLDLSSDATKMFHDQDPTRVHLDMNVISPESHYQISFYVEGKASHIVGLYTENSIRIYIGSAPQTGKCLATLPANT